jgi:hypothetical protein
MNEAQGMSQGQDVSSSPGAISQPAQSMETSHETPVQSEKVFKQSDVNGIVAREKARAIEEYRRQQHEQPQYLQQKYGDSFPDRNVNHAQNPSNPDDRIRQLAAEEAQRLRDEWVQDARNRSEAEQAQRTVQNFWNKMASGKEKYQDFDTVISNVEVASFPNVVQLLANHVENAHDLMHYFGNDPVKMDQLENLANRSPKAAFMQLQKLSQSIKDNDAASKIKLPNEPLSQMRPSNTGTDNGVMGVKDYRAKWKV